MKNPIAARFGRNFARARKRIGISQEEVSLRASLHRTEVSQLERGLRLCRLDTLVKLRDALGVPTDDLLDGIAWNPGDYSPGGFETGGGEER